MYGKAAYMRESETHHTREVQRWKGEWRYKTSRVREEVMCLGVFKGSLQDAKESRCLVNRSLPCHISVPKRLWLMISFLYI